MYRDHENNFFKTTLCPQVRETSQMKHLNMTGESHKELVKLQEDKKHLQEQVEVCGSWYSHYFCSFFLHYILKDFCVNFRC